MVALHTALKAEAFIKIVKPSPLREAIDLHAAAKRAYVARGEKEGESGDMFAALARVAETPCADAAEFVEKIGYLIGEERAIWGKPDAEGEFGSTLRALELRFS